MGNIEIEKIYTNVFLISVQRGYDFNALVKEAEEETEAVLNDYENYPKGYDGLLFMEKLSCKMGSSLIEILSLTEFQRETIVENILKGIDSYSEAYETYYDDSCEDSIEFQGNFIVITEKDRNELLKYYNAVIRDYQDDKCSIYTRYGIIFQKFLDNGDDLKHQYSISICLRYKSKYMYDFIDIWYGNEGFPAEFIEQAILEYTNQLLEAEALDEKEDKYIESINAVQKIEVEKPVVETYLPDGRKCIEEFIVNVYDTTKTIDLLDKFEGIGREEKIAYKRLVIGNGRYTRFSKVGTICFHLVIERGRGNDYVGDITFTQFKKGETYELHKYMEQEITDEIIEQYKDKNVFYKFSKPYLLRAQNSSNRTGYGWEWDWSGGYGDYIEGTLYGETTNYFFAGAYISTEYTYYAEKRKPFVQPIVEKNNIIDGKYVIKFYKGKLKFETQNEIVQRFLKIKNEKGDKYIPISVDEVENIAYVSESVFKKYKDKLLSGDFEFKRVFIE